jgi:hypothetical protein
MKEYYILHERVLLVTVTAMVVTTRDCDSNGSNTHGSRSTALLEHHAPPGGGMKFKP